MKKLLAANRSEIAIRCFRAATELGLRTVAVYSYEDRFSLHRHRADESFRIGPPEGGQPVGAYLDIAEIIDVAKRAGVDGIHPGYGFLAENAGLARACEAEGIAFIGPTPAQLETFGDKTAAKRLAQKVGVPTVPGTEVALVGTDDVAVVGGRIGYPLIVKASFGGGGRGMRVVRRPEELLDKIGEAQREAAAAFGHADVFLERYIPRAKHIEVQIFGDGFGNLVHLWERDCSVQRRHQKVVEIAPGTALPTALRRRICDAAVALCRAVSYRSAGTVEFLVDLSDDSFYFIEVNPRIQVEHTVTEVVTGIDLVRSQILVADGHALHQPPIGIPPQGEIEPRGVALQCRITTEDPENGFIPDYGRITTYRSPGGFAVRLDGGNGFAGYVITPYFDSLLVKVTTWGRSLEEAVQRAERSLREFRIRGVKTNIAFLLNLLRHDTFTSGGATTTFVDDTPALLSYAQPRDRATKILAYLGDVIVNGRADVGKQGDARRTLTQPVAPRAELNRQPPDGTRQQLQALGPERFAAWARAETRVLITDTTMRDAHQSLLATRVRTFDIVAAAEWLAQSLPELFSLEMWGGATYDTSLRFLQEDPWERLAELRRRVPNILFQMLLRGSNAVGYSNYPDNVVREFVKRSSANGIDVFRIFDSLNWAANMQVAIEAVRNDTSAICEAAICYTGDILDPTRTKYSLKYYVALAKELVAMGSHILAIKDMAGLCRPYAAAALVKALRDETDVPIHFHTHDTSGLNAASVLSAADAGADIVDAALASMSGMTSQPCLNSLVAALKHTRRDTKLDDRALADLDRYWSSVRDLYYPFEEGLRAPAADLYRHEMPGGQYTNLRQQAKGLGLEDRWPEICEAYANANQLFGDIVKVTPSSKVVGDMALFMVSNDLSVDDVLSGRAHLSFPRSVVEMMQGMIGRPADGWPEAIQRTVLQTAGVEALPDRPGALLPPADMAGTQRELSQRLGREAREEEVLSFLLYGDVFLRYADHVRQFGDTSTVPTAAFFFGLRPGEETEVEIDPGRTLIIRYLSVGEARPDGSRTVFFELNGQPREITVLDRSAAVTVKGHPKADPDNGHHVGAPMSGKIVDVSVTAGQTVTAGQRLFSIEAMKMESAVYSPRAAKVARLLVSRGAAISTGDLLLIFET